MRAITVSAICRVSTRMSLDPTGRNLPTPYPTLICSGPMMGISFLAGARPIGMRLTWITMGPTLEVEEAGAELELGANYRRAGDEVWEEEAVAEEIAEQAHR